MKSKTFTLSFIWIFGVIFSLGYLVLFLSSLLLDIVLKPSGFFFLAYLFFPSVIFSFFRECFLNNLFYCDSNLIFAIGISLNMFFYFIIGALFGYLFERRKMLE